MTNFNQNVTASNIQTDPSLSFPEPTGDYAVGTTSYHFVDRQREETYTKNPDDNREITAKVWYPSVEVPDAATEPYLSEELSGAIASGLEIPPEEFSNVTQSIPTNSVANAPIAKAESEYPVLVFSHGFGGLPEFNTIKAEELASQGYVVVGINHTYDSSFNVFPDGRIIPQSSVFGGFSGVQEIPELLAQSVNIRAEDAQFVLDELEKIDAGDDPRGLLNGKLDLERVGTYGFSLGGATAAKILSEDPRFQAGINLDGGLFGDVANASLSQPFMTFNNQAFGTGNSSDSEVKEFEQLQQTFVNNLQNEGYEVTIRGTEHFDFNDLPFLVSSLDNSGIELGNLKLLLTANANSNEDFEPINPELAAQIINDYTTAFFEQHLNNQESPLLTEASSPYPEVIFESYGDDLNLSESQFGTVDADLATNSADKQTQEVPEELQEELHSALNQTAQDLGASDIGVSVGVVTPDGIWIGATGVSNLETRQATQPEDLFNIGSISKPYTSAVILKLQEQGKLSLDDTLDKWLPEIAAQITNGENLTIRQLLNGKGGLWDYLSVDAEFIFDFFNDYSSGANREWQPEELVAYAFNKPLFSGQGSTEEWTYTNTGNLIAALIAQKATGKPFKQILSEEILEPLGLNNTFFTTEDVSLKQRARGYDDISIADGIGQDGVLEDYSRGNTAISYGSGSIVSSAEDVAKFFDSLASGDLLSLESTNEIFNYVDTGFKPGSAELDKFGLGVYPGELPWGKTRTMDGSWFGYKSQVDYFPSHDTTISVLTNRGTIGQSALTTLTIEAYKASIANTLGLNEGSAIKGNEADDYLTGTSSNNVINSLEGDDIIIGKKGLDALDGGVGDDFLEGGDGNDVLFGKEGDDNLYGGRDDDFLNGGVGDDLLEGGKGSDFIVGGDGKDIINGGKGSDFIAGGAGNDRIKDTQGNNYLYGNDGDDLLFVGKGDDTLYGDAGSDRLLANEGNDHLFGGDGYDYLNGGKGDDRLIGEKGNDTLIGTSGSDTLTGGDGSDRFILSLEGTDILTDFTPREDFLKLPDISFADLEISQGQGDNAANTVVTFDSETLAVLNDFNSAELSQSDFV